MNNVNLAGRISNKFDVQEFGKGKEKTKVIRFTVAVNRNEDTADFIPVKAFNSIANTIDEYFNVGDQIILTGSINTGKYDNEDGDTVYTMDIIANRIEFGAKKQEQKKGTKK